ncbi:MAG: hypothetical protein WB755_21760 [Terriglobales bacterium]
MPEEINRLVTDQLDDLLIDPGLKIDRQLSSPRPFPRKTAMASLFARPKYSRRKTCIRR